MIPIPWERLARAEVHPLRILVLEAIYESDKPLYSGELAGLLDSYGSQIAFHLTALADAGLIVLDHREQRRGATAKFYRAASS